MRGIHQPYELTLYSRKILEYEVLSMEKEFELAWRYRMGDSGAGQAIIDANLRLVLKISRAYFHYDQDPLDIIHAGNAGLVKALETFDPAGDIRFSRHAVWWVHKYIWNFVHGIGRETTAPAGGAPFSLPLRAKVFMKRGVSWFNSLMGSKTRNNDIQSFRQRHAAPLSSGETLSHLTVVKNLPWKESSMKN